MTVLVNWLRSILCCACVVLSLSAGAYAQGARMALVVGVSDYAALGAPLVNSLNDAREMAATLRERGFGVRLLSNPTRREMLAAVNAFAGDLPGAAVAMFYFSGHGVQVDGANYLLPRDMAPAAARNDLVDQAVGVADIANRMTAANPAAFHLLVVDACRDNPFPQAGKGFRVVGGLSAQPAGGVMMLQAAGSNQVALDVAAPGDTHSLFTGEFLKAIRTPGLSVRNAIQQVRTNVRARAAALGHAQTPALYDEAAGDFVFTPGSETGPPQASIVVPPAVPAPVQARGWVYLGKVASPSGESWAGPRHLAADTPRGLTGTTQRLLVDVNVRRDADLPGTGPTRGFRAAQPVIGGMKRGETISILQTQVLEATDGGYALWAQIPR